MYSCLAWQFTNSPSRVQPPASPFPKGVRESQESSGKGKWVMGADVGRMQARAGTGSRQKRGDRYRGAERTWWHHFDLDPAERFIELESPSTRLRVLEIGTGPPILFVHGTAGAAPVWAPLVKELSGFTCLLLDRPGWGLSSPVDYARSDYGNLSAELLRSVLDVVGLDHVHLIGGSIGNVWALRLAEAHPEQVGGVVLIGGGPLTPEIPVPKIVRAIASPLGAVMLRLPEKPGRVRGIVRANGDGAALEAGRMEEFIDWRVALGRDTDSMLSERSMIRTIVDWRRGAFRPGVVFEDADLAALDVPVLMIYGASDPVGPAETWRRFTETLPRASLRVVDGAGHMPWFHDPPGVAAAVDEFLRRSENRASGR
jgi:pimeloyl-ACP methyl ester carboxylesterase